MRKLQFGCEKPGGRALSPTTANQLRKANPDAVCDVKLKSGQTVQYKRKGIAAQTETQEKLGRAEKRLKKKETKLGTQKEGSRGRLLTEQQLTRARDRVRSLREKIAALEPERRAQLRKIYKPFAQDARRQLGQPVRNERDRLAEERAIAAQQAEQAPLYPKLIGSEKQVKWADDIRDKWSRDLDMIQDLTMQNKPGFEYGDFVRAKLGKKMMGEIKDAKTFIDNRVLGMSKVVNEILSNYGRYLLVKKSYEEGKTLEEIYGRNVYPPKGINIETPAGQKEFIESIKYSSFDAISDNKDFVNKAIEVFNKFSKDDKLSAFKTISETMANRLVGQIN